MVLRPDGSLAELGTLHDVAAVRERCNMVYRWVADGRLPHFTLDESRPAAVAGYMADITREAIPISNSLSQSLAAFFRRRCRSLERACGAVDAAALERARIAVDLQRSACCSTPEPAMLALSRPARLATPHALGGACRASLDMFAAGLFSSDPAHPLRVDHAALARIDAATLARHFQVDGENPLVGLEQRSVLLRRLGTALSERPDMFARAPARPGNLVDYLLGIADQRRIAASAVLAALLESLSSIWPSGLMLDGFAVGDAGYHPAARAEGRTDRIVRSTSSRNG
jgi:hypothetical protein